MVQSVQSLIEDIGELISLPEIVMQINELVNSDASSATEIARVIGQDPAISTRILQVANSSMYGGQRQIDSINRAVTIRPRCLMVSRMMLFRSKISGTTACTVHCWPGRWRVSQKPLMQIPCLPPVCCTTLAIWSCSTGFPNRRTRRLC